VRIGQARPSWADAAWTATLVGLVVGTWCWAHDRTSLAAWTTPISYRGDALFLTAYLKAARDGHVSPGAELSVPELNAPFEANWNDHPRTLRVVFLGAGLLSRATGLFAAMNLLLLLAHVLAAASLFAVARYFGARREWAFAGGIAFGLSHFLFWRSLDHLDLAFLWHLPLCVLVIAWAFGRRGIPLRSRRFVAAALVTGVTATHNPYYAALYAQFLLLAAVAQALRRAGRSKTLAPAALLSILAVIFVLDNIGSLVYQWQYGRNPGAERPYGNLERYALKPLELFFPPPGFGLLDWGRVAHVHWERRIYRGEGGSPYLGIVGAVALASLFAWTLAGALRRPPRAPSPTAAAVAWVILYSILGGINQLIGAFGFVWLRGANRFSVWILTLVLLFLVTRRIRSRRKSVVLALLASLIAVWDQVPPRANRTERQQTRGRVESDRSFVAAIEALLPEGAMLFMLPVIAFPEGRPVLGATEYEHLRPYLHSRTLRFSFGSDKGRPRESWQGAVGRLAPREMAATLEDYGFSGILLNRRGYPQDAADLLADLAASGRHAFLDPAGDYALVPLQPAGLPVVPGSVLATPAPR
jgi:hypothetical protein